ncbi:MAG TPA: hypothetical protein VG963_08365, partial [Polyangiaceae bacterium]|nr:hypothetical protein [Polyangiaceae bacterium]
DEHVAEKAALNDNITKEKKRVSKKTDCERACVASTPQTKMITGPRSPSQPSETLLRRVSTR